MTAGLIWVWIYLGMIVGIMAWLIVVFAIYQDFKNKDKK
jgi:hypothetical protein